jgi:preprotein translocase subunit SecD
VIAFVADGSDVPEPESADRLAELGAVDGGAGGAATTNPATTATAGGPPVVTDDRPLDDGFYPVEATEPAPCRSPGMRPDRDNTSCYRLPDEPAAGTDIVEEAEAAVDPTSGGWRVDLVFTEDGIGAFNDVAAICSQFGATCPVGQLALLVGGEVVTAPTITEPSFERDQIVVSGEFGRDGAEALADALAG